MAGPVPPAGAARAPLSPTTQELIKDEDKLTRVGTGLKIVGPAAQKAGQETTQAFQALFGGGRG